MNASHDLRKAAYGTLSGEITGAVYSAVPAGAAFPYSVLGQITSVPDDDLTNEGADLTMTIYPWDRGNSVDRLETIIEEIDELLHNAELQSGGRTFFVAREISETFTEKAADGATLQRGRLVYRAKTYE